MSTKKGFTGHLLDFAGVVEPPNNLEEPDSECHLSHFRDNAVAKSVEVTLPNSFAFGGHNVNPVFGSYPHTGHAQPRLPSTRPEAAAGYTRSTTGDTIPQRQTL